MAINATPPSDAEWQQWAENMKQQYLVLEQKNLELVRENQRLKEKLSEAGVQRIEDRDIRMEGRGPIIIREFHARYEGMDPLFHASCANHPTWGVCAPKEDAERQAQEHVENRH